MQTTSSPTSSRRSSGRSRKGLIAWLTLATILVVLGFAGQSSGESNPDPFYDYGLALSSLFIYGILVGITFWAGTAYGDPLKELGLTVFSVKWTAIAVGLIFLVLGPPSSSSRSCTPARSRATRRMSGAPSARAFFVNGLVAATFVPFAEELFFRGLGVRALTFLGSAVAILGTALAFGLGHGILVALPIFVASARRWPGFVALRQRLAGHRRTASSTRSRWSPSTQTSRIERGALQAGVILGASCP